MSINSIVKSSGIEAAVAFGVGSLINSFIPSTQVVTSENYLMTALEVGAALIANGIATATYLDYARSNGEYDVVAMVPYMLTLAAAQPRLSERIQALSAFTSSKVRSINAPTIGTPVEVKSPAATANQTKLVRTVPNW